MENSTPDPAPAACPTTPLAPLDQWAKDTKELLHDVGTELGLREGFEYSEILPAIKALKGTCGDAKTPDPSA